MGIVNRRNAMLGWAAWRLIKRGAKQRAKQAVPTLDERSRRPNRSAVISAVLALAGGLWLLSKRRGADDHDHDSFG